MAVLGKSSILAKSAGNVHRASVNGDTVYLRTLSMAEFTSIQAECLDEDGEFDRSLLHVLKAGLVASMVCNEAGEREFRSTDTEAISAADSGLVEAIYKECQKLLDVATIEDAKKN